MTSAARNVVSYILLQGRQTAQAVFVTIIVFNKEVSASRPKLALKLHVKAGLTGNQKPIIVGAGLDWSLGFEERRQ